MFSKRLCYLILVSTCIRLLVAFFTELGNDEVYYYTYALHLQWNYFDHPPGVALLIRLSTLNLWLTHELFIRLGSILGAAAGTYLCYRIGCFIRNERTGYYAAVLYNTSIYASIIAGTFILPDSPQIVFWLAALLVLLHIVVIDKRGKQISPLQWLLFGLLSGICIDCKVHGIFLWFALFLYVLFYRRKLLMQPWLYVSGVFTLVLISPILWWNINNHFITFLYHSNRVEVHSTHIKISSFVQAFAGQIFYNNPVNVFLIVAGIYNVRKMTVLTDAVSRIILITGLPIIIVVTIISLFNPVLPHWSGPGFVTLSFIAAAYLDEKNVTSYFALPVVMKSSVWLILFVVFGGVLMIHCYPGTMGSKKESRYGSGDFTLDLSGWKELETQYSHWLADTSDGNIYSRLPIVCSKWFPASHIEYYIARPLRTELIGVGNLADLHNFAWLNGARHPLQAGDSAICIVPSNYSTDVTSTYEHSFSSMKLLHTFTATRSGKVTRFVTVWLLENYKPTDEVHQLLIK